MFGDKKKLKDTERSLISETVSIEGTINSSGAIDIGGLVRGPVYSKEIIIREKDLLQEQLKEATEIHGHMDGKIVGDDVVIGGTELSREIRNLQTILRLKTVLTLTVTSKKLIAQNQNFQLTFYSANLKMIKSLRKMVDLKQL